jgi:hypothetical protein
MDNNQVFVDGLFLALAMARLMLQSLVRLDIVPSAFMVAFDEIVESIKTECVNGQYTVPKTYSVLTATTSLLDDARRQSEINHD